MRDGQYCHVFGQVPEVAAEVPLGIRIQGAGHLVEDQQPGPGGERARQGDALALTITHTGMQCRCLRPDGDGVAQLCRYEMVAAIARGLASSTTETSEGAHK